MGKSILISKSTQSYPLSKMGPMRTVRRAGPYRPAGIKGFTPIAAPFKLSQASKHIYKELRPAGKKNRE